MKKSDLQKKIDGATSPRRAADAFFDTVNSEEKREPSPTPTKSVMKVKKRSQVLTPIDAIQEKNLVWLADHLGCSKAAVMRNALDEYYEKIHADFLKEQKELEEFEEWRRQKRSKK